MELKETEGEEELEHRKALLQRETLIQSLGSVKQLACMLHLRQQGQNPPSPAECQARVPGQGLTGQGNKGCSGTWWWPQPRKLMGWSGSGVREKPCILGLGKGSLGSFCICSKARLFLVMTSSQGLSHLQDMSSLS